MIGDLDPTELILRLDPTVAFSLFWFVLIFDLPRYTLGFLSLSLTIVLPRQPITPARPQRPPLVSAVLVGHNEAATIRECVHSLRAQSYAPIELICVSDGSNDGMERHLRQMRTEGLIDVALTTSLRGGKSSAANLGLFRARGELILTADPDCTFDREAVAQAVACFADPRTGAVTGNIAVRNSRHGLLTRIQDIEYLLSISLGKRLLGAFDQITCASGAFSMFRRGALAGIGGLHGGPGEDLDLTLRLRNAGWRIRFAENARCYTNVPERLRGLIRQRLRWERDALRLRLRKHRRCLDPRNVRFRFGEALHHVEFIVGHVGLTIAFPIYLAWLAYTFGAAAIAVLVVVTIAYIVLDVLALLCALAIERRSGGWRLLAYVFLHGLFAAYVLRAVRLAAYLQEAIFRTSYRDDYVPARVSRNLPHY